MRTPSDAPKNFIVQTTKLNAENIITPNETSSRQYLNETRKHIENFSHSEDGTSKYMDEHILYASFASKITNNQKWNAVDIYKIINGETESINYNKMYAINNNKEGTVTIPIVYHTNENIDIFWIKGEKIQGETNNILYNLQVEDITSTTYGQVGNVSDAFFAEIAEYVKNEGVANGKIEVNVNKNAHIFYGIKQNLKNELNTFIDQLNNVFVKDTNSNWILRKDTVGLIDRAHYNGELVKDGRLTGNFYSFRKLFKNAVRKGRFCLDAQSWC